MGLHHCLGLGCRYRGSADVQAVQPELFGAEVRLVHLQEEDWVVQAVVLVEVGRDGSQGDVFVIVGLDLDFVVACMEQAGQVDAKGCVSSFVIAQQVSAQRNLGCLGSTLEEQERGPALVGLADVDPARVAGRASIVAFGVAVECVARVGQRYLVGRFAGCVEVPVD